eukprot:Opistho-2@89865
MFSNPNPTCICIGRNAHTYADVVLAQEPALYISNVTTPSKGAVSLWGYVGMQGIASALTDFTLGRPANAFTPTIQAKPALLQGQPATAMSLGVWTQLTFSNTLLADMTSFTIEAWVGFVNDTTASTGIAKASPLTLFGLTFAKKDGSTGAFSVDITSVQDDFFALAASIPLDDGTFITMEGGAAIPHAAANTGRPSLWAVHVAITNQHLSSGDSEICLFVNGKTIALWSGTTLKNVSKLKPYIGSSGSNQGFIVDQYAVYNRALSTADIVSRVTCGGMALCPLQATAPGNPFWSIWASASSVASVRAQTKTPRQTAAATSTYTYKSITIAANPLLYFPFSSDQANVYDEYPKRSDSEAFKNIPQTSNESIIVDTSATAASIRLTNGFSIDPVGPFTVGVSLEMWIVVNEIPAGTPLSIASVQLDQTDAFILKATSSEVTISANVHYLDSSKLAFKNFPAVAISKGVRHHIVLTASFATGVVSLFVDGSAGSSTRVAANGRINSTMSLSIGGSDPQEADITVDEVALYDYEMANEIVAAHYQCGTGGACVLVTCGIRSHSSRPRPSFMTTSFWRGFSLSTDGRTDRIEQPRSFLLDESSGILSHIEFDAGDFSFSQRNSAAFCSSFDPNTLTANIDIVLIPSTAATSQLPVYRASVSIVGATMLMAVAVNTTCASPYPSPANSLAVASGEVTVVRLRSDLDCSFFAQFFRCPADAFCEPTIVRCPVALSGRFRGTMRRKPPTANADFAPVSLSLDATKGTGEMVLVLPLSPLASSRNITVAVALSCAGGSADNATLSFPSQYTALFNSMGTKWLFSDTKLRDITVTADYPGLCAGQAGQSSSNFFSLKLTRTLACVQENAMITATSQADIDPYITCTSIQSLDLTGFSASSISTLSAVSIIGDLIIRNTQLVSLDAFASLLSAGNVTISNNPRLSSLAGMSSLVRLTGTLSIRGAHLGLSSVDGPPRLSDVGGDLSLDGLVGPVTVSGLSSLRIMAGSVSIVATSIVDISALGIVRVNAPSSFTVSQNPSLRQFLRAQTLKNALYEAAVDFVQFASVNFTANPNACVPDEVMQTAHATGTVANNAPSNSSRCRIAAISFTPVAVGDQAGVKTLSHAIAGVLNLTDWQSGGSEAESGAIDIVAKLQELLTVAEQSAVAGTPVLIPEVVADIMSAIDLVSGPTNIGVMRASKASNGLDSIINSFGFAKAAASPCGTREDFTGSRVFIKSIKEPPSGLASNMSYTNARGETPSFVIPGGLDQYANFGRCVTGSFSVMTEDPFVPAANASGLRPYSDILTMKFQDVAVSNLQSSNAFVFTVAVRDSAKLDQPLCGFWNATALGWETSGCVMITRAGALVTCRCTHLTSFGVLFDTSIGGSSAIPSRDEKALSYLTYIGCSLSIVGCALTIITFVALPRLRTVPTILVMNLCGALVLVNLVYVAGIDKTSDEGGCKAVAIFLQSGLLSAFTWMGLIGHNVWRNVVVVKMGEGLTKLNWKHYATGWALPGAYVILCVIIDAGKKNAIQYGDENRCWISTVGGLVGAFLVPVGLIITGNIVVMVLAIRSLRRAAKQRSHSMAGAEGPDFTKDLLIYVSLLAILGCTWAFGYLGLIHYGFWYPFVILNCFQGVFIFCAYVLRARIYTAWQERISSLSSSFIGSSGEHTTSHSKGQSLSSVAYSRGGSSANLHEMSVVSMSTKRSGSTDALID